MRVLTTAIDKGEHKVPEGHKVTLYALAPGDALEINDETREHTPRKVSEKEAKAAKYLYLLRWIDGRTVAQFDVGGKVYVQPTKPDPQPKRRKDADDHHGDVEQERVLARERGAQRRGRRLDLEPEGEDTGGGAGPAGASRAGAKARRRGPVKRSPRKPRTRCLDLL